MGTCCANARTIIRTAPAAATAETAAPDQLPVTGADGGTLGALSAALGIAAGGGWVALRCKR